MRFLATALAVLALTSCAPEIRAEGPKTPQATVAKATAKAADAHDHDVATLGSLSMGRPNAGALVNGVAFPEGERWEILDATRAFATQESIDYLIAAIDEVHRGHPGAHKLIIGHLSRARGGPMRPHRSHQSGRDLDVSYYYRPDKAEWYRPAVESTLDLDRSWAFLRALLTKTDVEMILVDIRVQRLLKEHALKLGEDKAWLDSVFQFRGRGGKPIIKHAFGHRTHIHIRFFNPKAQARGLEAYDELAERKLIRPSGTPLAYLGHVARVAQLELPARRLPPRSGARVRGVTAAADAP